MQKKIILYSFIASAIVFASTFGLAYASAKSTCGHTIITAWQAGPVFQCFDDKINNLKVSSLADVNFTNLLGGQTLQWDGTNLRWVNANISPSGQNNTASCASYIWGVCLFAQKSGVDLQFKQIVGLGTVQVSSNSSNVILNGTGITSTTNLPCDYMLYSNSSNNIFAKNCTTGLIQFSGTDFSTVAQNALNQFSQTSQINHIIYIQPPASGLQYSITKRINVTTPTTFRGSGIDTVLKLHQNENGEMFYFSKGSFSSPHNTGLQYLRVDGNGSAQSGGDFIVKVDTGVFDAFFYRVWFDSGYGGGLNTFSNTQPDVYQCWFENMLGNGLVSVGATNINPPAWLENAGTSSKTIDNIFFNNAQKDVYVYSDLSAPRISGNLFVGSLRGSVVLNNDRYSQIDLNWFKRVSVQTNNTYPAVLLEDTSGANKENNTLVSSNTCFSDGSNFMDYMVDTDANVWHVDIVGNDCPYFGTALYHVTAGSNDFMVNSNRNNNLASGTMVRNNMGNTINNQFISGTGISISLGNTQDTVTNTGVISNSCSLPISCSGTNPSAFSLKPLCSVTAAGGETSLTCTLSASNKVLFISGGVANTGNASFSAYKIQFNSDSGNNYAIRTSTNGGADSTSGSQPGYPVIVAGTTDSRFQWFNFQCSDIVSSQEKRCYGDQTFSANGAANVDGRQELAWKWANTASDITSVVVTRTAGTGSFVANSYIAVFGYS